MDVLRRYADELVAHACKFVIVSAGERVRGQLRITGVTDVIASEGVYVGDARVGAAQRRAHDDA